MPKTRAMVLLRFVMAFQPLSLYGYGPEENINYTPPNLERTHMLKKNPW
jgi:hypothetical protein